MYNGYTQSQLVQQDILEVNGENGAKSIKLAPNSRALALDVTAPILWCIKTDGAGYATQTPYDISLHQQPKPIDAQMLQAFETRLTRLEGFVNESGFRQHEQPKDSNKSRNKYKSNDHSDANGSERSSD